MKKLVLNFLLLAISSSFITAQNIQHLSVDIPNPTTFYATQKQTNWCWAACNQMLLNSQGIAESQEKQVIKLFGQLVNQGAGGDYERAKLALGGTYKDVNGKDVAVTPYISYLGTHNDDPAVIISHLQKGIPLVMATKQHGRVCVGIDYDTDGTSYQVTNLRLLNPFTSSVIETFTMQQFLNTYPEGGLTGFMTIDINRSTNPTPDDVCPVCGTYGASGFPDLRVYVDGGNLMADGNGTFQLFPDPQQVASKYVNPHLNLAVQFDNNYSTATIFQGGQTILLNRK